MRGRAKAKRTLLKIEQRCRGRERRYRALTPRRHPEPLSHWVTQLRLSIARARRQIDASLNLVEASNARIDEFHRLAAMVR